jgi:EAL domain-containing protein (putative c-di-GMP-specific phosphodiesterase class I)
MSDRAFRLAPSDIDRAFQHNEFRVVFQPKVDLSTQRMTGAEVFVRWEHPQYGLLPPGLFLDFIEAQGRMPDLTGFVFNAALDGARQWKAKGRDWAVSINVAPGTVTSEGFADGLVRLVEEYGLEPERIIVEVPERAIAQEPETLCDALNQVRAKGVNVALDGGGIVPVDLSQFVPMPFTSIKVGGPASIRLAQRLGLKGKGAIAARLRFAHQYNLEAVAVGAEDEATMAGLAEVGFTAAQGIWIQRPLALNELLAWNGNWSRGKVSMEPVRVAVPNNAPAVARSTGQADEPVASAPPPHAPPLSTREEQDAEAAHGDHSNEVSKEEMQRALEAVRAKRAGQPALQPKPQQKAAPALPAMDTSDLEDIVEDEEATAPPVKRQGFGPQADGCPPMKGLVQRKQAKQASEDGATATRKGSLQDGVFS